VFILLKLVHICQEEDNIFIHYGLLINTKTFLKLLLKAAETAVGTFQYLSTPVILAQTTQSSFIIVSISILDNPAE